MARYAENTKVSAEKSRAEIEEILRKFGADAFSSGYQNETAFIMFRAKGRFIRLAMSLPKKDSKDFLKTTHGRTRNQSAVAQAHEQEYRRRWRSLALLVKAKLTAVQDGIVEFEAEFLPHIVMPDGKSVAEHTRPVIARAYETGGSPQLLLGYTAAKEGE